MNKLANKEYYELLLEAIDFFTQRFHIGHLLQTSLDFSIKLLKLKKAALFVVDDKGLYVLQSNMNYDHGSYTVCIERSLKDLPLYTGRILTSKFHKYLPKDFIEEFEVKMIIPLINDTELRGFIVTSGNDQRDFTEEEVIFADILMKLINASIESNLRLLEAQQIKRELDQKLFDLFVINQSTKALLAELDIENLYELATDVFSEVSGSKITSFGVLDETASKVKIVGYRNVNSFHTYYTEFTVLNKVCPSKMVLHVQEDEELLKEIFAEWERFKKLDAQYVVLVFKEELMGIVTLGECRTQKHYDGTIFELIQTLSSATCIALTNAKLFKTISQQKKEIENKLHTLEVFNRLSRNINACETEGELFSLALQTLQLAFGVEKAFVAKQVKENEFIIHDSVGVELEKLYFTLNKEIFDLLDDTFIQYESKSLESYFQQPMLIEALGMSNGIIISPVLFRDERVFSKDRPAYILVITSTQERLKHENLLILDTLTKNLKPILFQMNRLKDGREKFLQRVVEKISQRNHLTERSFSILWRKTNFNPFEALKNQNLNKQDDFYSFNGYEFLISEHEERDSIGWNIIRNPKTIDDIIASCYSEEDHC